ncbi:hypothetical protein G6553_09695 [Nocardioides sp. IC4_145]|uniref:hypothetical protein n=1 Tax=Nocardioides sp. IC4_145 TaxID=2714037 RepID=UPI001408FE51|nr:hypothetical protein [Nocardioides sp. IC4_145]NHC23441.1 hypothetical protein [Nocardioides sp. IC4_145]
MNSSGIKRGLAVSAISALAVAGIPALASPASAAPTDFTNESVVFTGPALNGGDEGAEVVLKVRTGVEVNLDNLELAATGSAEIGSQNTDLQSAAIVEDSAVRITDAASNEFGGQDGFDEIRLRVAVTTSSPGATATFRVFENEGDTLNNQLDAGEPRAQVAVTTGGQLARIELTPVNQTAAEGVESGNFTVTLRDAANRLTQLRSNQTITIAPPTDGEDTTVEISDGDDSVNDPTPADLVISSDEIVRGTDTFTATADEVDVYDITLTSNTDPVVSATATLDVVRSAGITDDEVDIVTGADTWMGFGDDTNPAESTTEVRVDQTSIRIDIQARDRDAQGRLVDAGGTVTLNVAGTNLRFGGQTSTTVSTVLDANGRGSLTITPDAGTIQENSSIELTGSFTQTIEFNRARVATVEPAAATYVSAVDGSVDVTVNVQDQFGDPISSGEVEAARTGGPNADTAATVQRKAVGPNGQVTFTFTNARAAAGQSDTVEFEFYRDRFAAAPEPNVTEESATIRYTVDGQGRDFTTRLDNVTASGTGYNPASIRVVPLTDTLADDNPATPGGAATVNESVDLEIANAEPGAPVTVTVDNGALILAPDEDRLSEGSSSITTAIINTGEPNAGNLPAGYRIVGTQSGLVTVTVTSANRTETSQFTVAPQSNPAAARNLAVSGPAEAVTGDQQVTYTVVVTDAFGNPIAGVSRNALNIQVSGPGAFQDSDALTNAAGELKVNVRLDDNANGTVTTTVQGLGAQFGAAENQLTATSPANSAAGLSASSAQVQASTIVKPGKPDTPVRQPITATAAGSNRASDNYDRVRVSVDKPEAAAGAAVELYKVNAQGKVRRVKTKALNANGVATFVRKDLNGKKVSKYFAKVRPTDTSKGDRTNAVRIK